MLIMQHDKRRPRQKTPTASSDFVPQSVRIKHCAAESQVSIQPYFVLVAASALLGAPAMVSTVPAQEGYDIATDRPVTLSLAKAAILELRGGVGSITVSRSSGPSTIVTAKRVTPGAEPRVQLVKHEKGITICSVYESGNPRKPNECLPMRKGRRFEGLKKDSPAVHFEVQLPDGVDLMADTATGNVTTTALTGNVSISVFRGNIAVIDGGSPDIRTNVMAGDTDATLGAFGGNGTRHLSFTATGGMLKVRIPANVPIDYWISSGMSIETPFQLHKTVGEVSSGHLGPPGSTISLRIDAGSLLAKVALLPAPAQR